MRLCALNDICFKQINICLCCLRYFASVKFCSYLSWINCCMERGTGFCKLFFQEGDKVIFLVMKHWTHGNYVLPSLQITEALLKERDKQAKWNGIPLLLQKLYEHSHPNSDFSQCQSILKVLPARFFLKLEIILLWLSLKSTGIIPC